MPIKENSLNSRKLNTFRNFVFSFGSFLLNTLLSFISRTVFIHLLSAEYLGVNGLFSNLLSVLSLAELGAGGAFVSMLYKPLAEHNNEQLASVMRAFKRVYFIIGCTIGIIGVCLIPYLNYFTPKSVIPNIVLIYLLFLGNSVITYFCADKKALISADQKNYLIIKYSQISIIVQYLLQILILYFTHNFLLYLCVQIICGVGFNLYVSGKACKLYPFLKQKAKPLSASLKKDAIQKIKGGFCVHAGYIVASGTDSLIISHFLGLTILGIYSNYLLIIGIVNKLSAMVFSALRASVSNLVVTSNEKVNYDFFLKLNFLAFVMFGFFGTCLITLFDPFINVWIGSGYVMDTIIVILAVLLYLTGSHGLKLPLIIYRDVMGLYYKDRYISLLEGMLNLFISLILVQKFGLIGVLLGTLLSSICTTISSSALVYHYVFHISVWEYWKNFIKYCFALIAVGCISYFISHMVPYSNWLQFFVMALVCSLVTLMFYFIIFYHTKEFQYYWGIIRKLFTKH